MSGKRRPGRTLCILIGAQAVALAALAQQTPEDRTRTDRATPPASTGERATMDHSRMKPVTPQSFAAQAAVIGKAEIELAQLALQNTKNEEIRIYAERMVKRRGDSEQ